MRHLILKKISRVLNSGINSEERTLYLLAEIRKILDLDKKTKSTLSIFCDWVLHSKLSYESTTKYFLQKFEKYIVDGKDIKKIANEIMSNQINFFKLDELKTELTEFLISNKLPKELVNHYNRWTIFIKLLLEILKECPIAFDKGKIEKLSLDEDKAGYSYYRFRLRKNQNIIKIKLKLK